MGRELTDFQVQCEQCLVQALSEIDCSVIDRSLNGQEETFITGSINDADLTFWIYEDMADFKTTDAHPVFEKLDFDSLDELADAFVASVIDSITKGTK